MAAIEFPDANWDSGTGNNGSGIAFENSGTFTNFGSIQFLPEQSKTFYTETPLIPISTVPFRRNPNFIGREILLDVIEEKCSIPGSRIALVGLGGVGKSQLAIEYSYRIRAQFPETWVFWVYASNAARLENSFREIAERAKIPGRDNPKANIFKLVQSWLHESRRRWILIVDNIEDIGLLREIPRNENRPQISDIAKDSTQSLLQYLPGSLGGSIIITCRSRDVAMQMVSGDDIIQVEPMTLDEALELFQRTMGLSNSPSEDILRLMGELDSWPLAIVQAAGYIKRRWPRVSILQYLERFKQGDNGATRLLNDGAGQIYRDFEAKNAILISLYTSFDKIRPSAASLLSLMSFFDRYGISENLLRVRHSDKSNLEDLNSGDDRETVEFDHDHDFTDDIATLSDYLFISISANGTMFSMHQLVQLAARAWLNHRGQLEHWKEQFIDHLSREFLTSKFTDSEECRPLYPHIRMALSQRPKSEDYIQKWITLLYRGAQYALETGNIADAIELARKSLKASAELQGSENSKTLAGSTILAKAYCLQGRWDEAETLQKQVMAINKAKLGEYHPDTLSSIAILASTYRHQGRIKEAELLEAPVLERSVNPMFGSILMGCISEYKHTQRFTEKEIQSLETVVSELQQTPPNQISIGFSDTRSITNKLKGRFEDRTGKCWDWWPLSPYKRDLVEGEARLHWTCVCGDARWAEVPTPFAIQVFYAIQNLAAPNSPHGQPVNVSADPQSSSPGTQNQGTSTQSNSLSQNTMLSQSALQLKSSHRACLSLSQTSSLHVFLVLDSQPIFLNDYILAQKDVSGMKDEQFFAWIRNTYYSHRGWFPTWLGLSVYSHCEFYQSLRHDGYEYTPVKRSYPSTQVPAYHYDPKPMNSKQPIVPHQFGHWFYKQPGHPLSLRTFHQIFGRKPFLTSNRDHHVVKIPKRETELEEGVPEMENFWGLLIVEKESTLRMALWSFFLLLPSIYFFFAWLFQWGHTSDLQNASIPILILLGPLGTFLGNIFRKPPTPEGKQKIT